MSLLDAGCRPTAERHIGREQATPGAQHAALLPQVGSGTKQVVGLATAMTMQGLPAWPVELCAHGSEPVQRLDSAVEVWERIERAVVRAGEYLAEFPLSALRFDAALGIGEIRETLDSECLRIAMERALSVADRDVDNPLRRLWVPDLAPPADKVRGWAIPEDGTRVNTNRVVIEALCCDLYGLRAETLAYLEGPMRDDGGYHTTHALWALTLARENGCLETSTYERIARGIQPELLAHQPQQPDVTTSLDVDLYAERLLVVVLSGYPGPEPDEWVRVLLDRQLEDGGWGVVDAEEESYWRYHATMVTIWALAEWVRATKARIPQ